MSRSRLEKSFVFKRFYEDLSDRYGDKKASAIWTYAQKELQRLEEAEPGADKNSLSWKVLFHREIGARIAQMYTECVDKYHDKK